MVLISEIKFALIISQNGAGFVEMQPIEIIAILNCGVHLNLWVYSDQGWRIMWNTYITTWSYNLWVVECFGKHCIYRFPSRRLLRLVILSNLLIRQRVMSLSEIIILIWAYSCSFVSLVFTFNDGLNLTTQFLQIYLWLVVFEFTANFAGACQEMVFDVWQFLFIAVEVKL